jgi:RHH-type transcriptional regulator, rel operon repressor / antitoxin RelB
VPWALRDGQWREGARAGAVDDALLHRVMRPPAGPEGMSEDTITVRVGSDQKAALAAIAAPTHRDLSLVIGEALNAYLELHAWQLGHVEEGMRQADAGELASSTHIRAALARWRR